MQLSSRVKWILVVGLLASAVIELVFLGGESGHGGGVWHHIPLFDFVFGAASCWIIVVASKALGHSWLQRPEGHYDDNQAADTERAGS